MLIKNNDSTKLGERMGGVVPVRGRQGSQPVGQLRQEPRAGVQHRNPGGAGLRLEQLHFGQAGEFPAEPQGQHPQEVRLPGRRHPAQDLVDVLLPQGHLAHLVGRQE